MGLFGGPTKQLWQYTTLYCTNTQAHKSNEKTPAATVICTKCDKYYCAACHDKAHRKDKHTEYVAPTEPLRAYVVLGEQVKQGDSHIRRHLKFPGGPSTFNWRINGCSTLYDCFVRSAQLYPHNKMLGTRGYDNVKKQATGYEWISYSVAYDKCDRLQSGLVQLGLKPYDRVGLYSINRAEWTLLEYASYFQSMIPVPLYDTLGPDTTEYIIKQAEIRVVACSHDKVESLLEIAKHVDCLVAIIAFAPQKFDPQPKQLIPAGTKSGNATVYSFGDIELMGMRKAVPHHPPQPDDLVTLCYTSGTTGMPKGVELTHKNIVSNIAAVEYHSDDAEKMTSEDVSISYLPLPHIMERNGQANMIAHGSAIGYFRGSPLLLVEDVAVLQPTFFPGPPRLYNRLFDAITSAVDQQGGLKAALYHRGMAAKKAKFERTGEVTHAFWDRLVFSKVAARLGGRVRVFATGSAPISDACKDFLRFAFSCPVVEGYGLTETSSGTSLAGYDDDRSNGNVGIPYGCNEIMLRSVPEMNYNVTDVINGKHTPRGEVCIRGLSVFRGYYKEPEKTAEAKTEDGWFLTGDVGQFLPNGVLKIIDRKKNIFKLSQGEYIAVEKIENVYSRAKLVAQSFVYGDSLQSCLVGIIVPDEPVVRVWAQKNGIPDSTSFKDLCSNAKLKKAIMDEIAQVSKEAKLNQYEKVKDIHLAHDLFSPENGILTPTQKLQRTNAKKAYLDVINQMYANIGKAGDASKNASFIGSKL